MSNLHKSIKKRQIKKKLNKNRKITLKNVPKTAKQKNGGKFAKYNWLFSKNNNKKIIKKPN